jgi:hypothetical protein
MLQLCALPHHQQSSQQLAAAANNATTVNLRLPVAVGSDSDPAFVLHYLRFYQLSTPVSTHPSAWAYSCKQRASTVATAEAAAPVGL